MRGVDVGRTGPGGACVAVSACGAVGATVGPEARGRRTLWGGDGWTCGGRHGWGWGHAD